MISRDKVLEASIKECVIKHVFDKDVVCDDFFVDEFNIANFTRRVDLVYSKGPHIFAFEIKSEFDSLSRLKGQVDEYLTNFDKVTVVAASKHIDNVLKIVPSNVAIWEVVNDKLKIVRRGRLEEVTNKIKFIRMMTLTELLSLAKKKGIKVSDKKRKIVELSLLSLSTNFLRKEAINRIKVRYEKRNTNFYDRTNYTNYGKEIKRRVRRKDFRNSDLDSLLRVIESL